MQVKVVFEKIRLRAKIPTFGSEEAAGADLYAVGNYIIKPREVVMVRTGLKMELPKGFEGQLRPRSGLATKKQLTVANAPGTVDSDYRGEIFVALINHGIVAQTVSQGDRVAQLVISRLEDVILVEGQVNKTKRGEGGFGSTGA